MPTQPASRRLRPGTVLPNRATLGLEDTLQKPRRKGPIPPLEPGEQQIESKNANETDGAN
jgi:hypothetical protein